MVRAVMSNILSHDEDAQIRQEFNALCVRIDNRLKGKQSDEQIVLKAIRAGCWTLEDIQDETGFTLKFVKELVKELQRLGKIEYQNNLYKAVQNVRNEKGREF